MAHRIDSYFEEKIRFRAERVSVASRVLLERARAIGIPAERVSFIPNGAPTDYIVPQDSTATRRHFRLPEGAPILLAVRNGDMCREVRIFGEVLRQIPQAVLVMVGEIPQAALALAERLSVKDRIARTGRVSDEEYPLILSCGDVCMCPLEDSLNDRARWPTKILDFLTAGRATVTNAVGEVEALFRKRKVGVLAGHSDEEFAGEIVELWRGTERRRFLGELARKVMVAEWDWRIRGREIAGLVAA
jgi:glycosyltransferase involved in cell wall biosynthesis